MHTKKYRKKTRQSGCGMCGKKRCKNHKKQTKRGGCGTCTGGGQKGGTLGSSVGILDNVATLNSTLSTSFFNIFRGMSGLPALPTF